MAKKKVLVEKEIKPIWTNPYKQGTIEARVVSLLLAGMDASKYGEVVDKVAWRILPF